MLEKFFTSKTRVKLLEVFLTHPEDSYYARELSRLIGITLPSVLKELKNLRSVDFIKDEKKGQESYYKVNKLHPIYPELKRIIYKTEAAGDLIRDSLKNIEGIEAVLLYGSIARDEERPGSDLDMLIIGDPDQDKIYKMALNIEKELGREVNFTTFTSEEWKNKAKGKNSFAMDILRNKIIPIIGDINGI